MLPNSCLVRLTFLVLVAHVALVVPTLSVGTLSLLLLSLKISNLQISFLDSFNCYPLSLFFKKYFRNFDNHLCIHDSITIRLALFQLLIMPFCNNCLLCRFILMFAGISSLICPNLNSLSPRQPKAT